MKMKFFIIKLMLLTQMAALAQEDWNIYTFGNICSFRIPNTMELRDPESISGVYINKVVDNLRIKYDETLPNVEIQFQQAGLGSDNLQEMRKVSSLYARVLVADIKQDFLTQTDVARLNPADIKMLSKEWEKDARQDMKKILPNGILTWYPLKRMKIAGKWSLVSSYKRTSSLGTFTNVRQYYFFLKGHLLRFTISYREKESALWKEDLSKIMNTLSFN